MRFVVASRLRGKDGQLGYVVTRAQASDGFGDELAEMGNLDVLVDSEDPRSFVDKKWRCKSQQ